MKTVDTLTTLFKHHLWANLSLLEHCKQLSDEQLDTAVVGGFGSIRDTLTHIVTAEQSYYSRISTGQMYRHPENRAPMTIADLKDAISKTGNGLITWATKVQAEDVVQINWDGTMRDVPKTILLTQAINHATEHRSQIMTILTQLGIQPPELDSWSYFDQLGQ